MLTSLLTRLVYALVLLGMISILAFGMSRLVPGDEILDYLSIDDSRYSSSADALEQRNAYAKVAAKRGLDLPLFYFSVTPGYYPDSLFRLTPATDRDAVIEWIRASKNKEGSLRLHHDLRAALSHVCPQSDTSAIADQWCAEIGALLNTENLFTVHHGIIRLRDAEHADDPSWTILSQQLQKDIDVLVGTSASWTTWDLLPAFRWHGTHNQYHRWLIDFITFKPVTSLIDGRNAWLKILEALKWTLLLNGLAFVLAICLGMWIGIWSAKHDGQQGEKVVTTMLFAWFAIPGFWLATLLIYFLASGEWLTLFPAGGLGPYHSGIGMAEKSVIIARHFTLPVLCLAMGSLAYVSRQMKQSVLNQFGQPYVMALRAQGIAEKNILRKHVIRNALFPMITMIGGALPALLSGSLIIEVIFSIPGMGRLLYTSLMARDWPVVFPVLMLGAVVTVIAYILTDVIYKWADPRVKSLEP